MSRPRLYATAEAARAANTARTIRRQAERKARGECPTCGVPVERYIYCALHRWYRCEATKRSQRRAKNQRKAA